jgi:N12 class adenine-specific DNA methylase
MADQNKPRIYDESEFVPETGNVKPVKTGLLRKAGDLAVGFGMGAVGATKALTDVAGAENAVSQGLEGVNKFLDKGISYETKDRQYQAQQIQDAAKGKGFGAEVAAGMQAFAADPLQNIAQGAGSIAPFLAAQFVPGVGQSAAGARVAQLGMGLGMGAGTAKGAIHEEVKKRELAAGKTEQQATAAADAAQSYGGPNTDQIALGTALGGLDAATGAVPVATRLLRQKLGREAATDAAQKIATPEGIIRAGAKGALAEMPTEFAQGGQEQLAANIAAQRAGYDADTWAGVAGQGTMEALAAGPMGVGFGIAGRNRGASDPLTQPMAEDMQPQDQGATDGQIPPVFQSDATPVLDADRMERMLGDVPTTAPPAARPSELMGLDASAGPLSAAAVTAVDSGASGFGLGRPRGEPVDVTPLTSAAGGQIDTQKSLGERPIIDVEARWIDDAPRQGDVMAPNNAPFESQALALQMAQQSPQGGEVVGVPNGFVVRPKLLGFEQQIEIPTQQQSVRAPEMGGREAQGKATASATSDPLRLGFGMQQAAPQSPPQAKQQSTKNNQPVRDGREPIPMGMIAPSLGALTQRTPTPTQLPESHKKGAQPASIQSVATEKTLNKPSQEDADATLSSEIIKEANDFGLVGERRKEFIVDSFASAWSMAKDEVKEDLVVKNALRVRPTKAAKEKHTDDSVKAVFRQALKASASMNEAMAEGKTWDDIAAVSPVQEQATSRPANWRKNMISAAKVAKDMGITAKGKKLKDLVGEIDAADEVAAKPEKPASGESDLGKKLAKGYGYDGGIDIIPAGLGKTARKLYEAMLSADTSAAQKILHPENKRSREAFESLFDGRVKLPKTVSGTNAIVADVLGKIAQGKEKDLTGKQDVFSAAAEADLAPDPTPATAPEPASTAGFSSLEKALQAKSHAKELSGDVGIVAGGGVVRYVSLEDAVAAAKQAIESGVRPVAFQILDATGIRIGDVDRVLGQLDKNALAAGRAQVAAPALASAKKLTQTEAKELMQRISAKTESTAADFIRALDEAKSELPAGYSISAKLDSVSLMFNGKHAINGLSRTADGVKEAVRLAKFRHEASKPIVVNKTAPTTEALMNAANSIGKLAVVNVGDKPAAKPTPVERPSTQPSADSILDDELKDALGKLGDVLGDVFGAKLNITGQQYTAGDLLPALSKVVELLVKKGLKSFSQSTGKAAQLMRADPRTAAHVDSISPRQWKAAYNAIAEGFDGTDSEDAINALKADEVLAIVAPNNVLAQNKQPNAESKNATPDKPDQKALENIPAKNDSKPERGGEAGASPASGGEPGSEPDSGADGGRVSAARGGRGGASRVFDPATRAASGRRPRGAGADGAGTRVPQADAGLSTPETASAPNIPAANFAITPDLNLGVGGEVAKFNDNIAAIKTLKALEGERRRATPSEQRVLARFVGWGGLANAFPNPETGKFKPEWEKRGNELRELLTPSEYRAASRSTRNAHYTSEVVVGAMWNAVRRLGYRNGLALESSMGSGNFLGLMPNDLSARFIGVEYDSITARLAGALYPQATVLHSGFQDVALPEGAFDLDIGNPPFGSESLRFQYKPELRGVSIHNQFFHAGVDALRPGGLKISVVSSFLMDAQDTSSRMALASKAKLIAAIRLPSTAFKENARTDVVTDIIILQRRSKQDEADATEAARWITKPPSPKELKEMGEEGRSRVGMLTSKYGLEMDWVTTSPVPDPLGGEPILVNSYFANNPSQIVGVMDRSGTMRTSGMMNVRLEDPSTLGERLGKLVAKLPQDIVSNAADVAERTEQAHKLLGEAMRISVARQEPGHVSFDEDGKLTRVIEREYGDRTVLQRQTLTPKSPWSAQLFVDSLGRWYKVDVRMDAAGNPVKVTKDGKATKLNEYVRTTYENEADVPDSMRLGQLAYDRLLELVGMRDLLKRQLVLETEDAPKLMMDGNRKKLAKAYQAYVDKHGPINRRANAALLSEMPDGGLVLALESSYEPARTAEQAKKSGLPQQGETVKPAPIMTERVVPKYEPPTSAETPADALAITLAERGVVDIEHIAKLLKQTPEQAEAALAAGDKPLVFKDPETNTFETANAYLSGQVRRKLMAAKSAGLEKNVKALEAVQPERWGAENVSVQIGASWVPPRVYADFAEHLMGGQAKVYFSALTNTFSVSLANPDRSKADQWSTERMNGATILSKLLNSQTPTVTYTDSEGKTHTDKDATTLAILKGREIVAEFGDWIFKDGQRREELVDSFNEKFNTRVTRQYDGQHLKLPGKVPDQIIKMRRHQMNAIWRGISSRSMLVDHTVGAGKTFTAIARAMERRRMGLAQKPTVVVPNHLVEQWAADVYRLYPAAKVLAATKKDFEKKNRRRLLSRVATGDYDIVILPHSSFGFVGISPETELRYLEEELRQAVSAVKEAQEQAEEDGDVGFRKPMGVKEAERLVAKIEGRMAKVREGSRDRLLTFEQLGIDDLTIDEAHEFKNLFYSSRLTKVRGMGDKLGSRKAADLYNKVRVLRDNGGAVTFMTGTPVSNSVVELYTMMRYLAPNELREMGMEHFDAWRAQFVDATPAFEPNESGRLQEVTRLGRTWSNMRNLMDLYYGFTDAVTNDDIKQWYREDNKGKEFPIPKVKGGERQLRKVAPTPAQESYLKEIIAGFDNLPNIKDVQERNAERLRLMDRARKLSLDIRAALPAATSKEEGGKLDQIAAEVKRIYDKSTPDLGTQLIFLDRSVPKAKGDDKKIKEFDDLVAKRDKAIKEDDDAALQKISETLEAYDAQEIEELRRAQAGGWNAYQQIKDNLISLGIPAAEIRFVQDANTDEQKQALFDAVNGGKVRVLIGSTPRMGAGTNVQQRLVGLHHADVTWKPSDIEQREGRIIRQGNQLLTKYGDKFEVEILAYATERTVDAKMWSLNATKLKAINGLRKYTGDFTMDLEDEESVSMAEMAALASGNPLLLERVTLESEIQNLELQERSHRRKLYGAEDALARAKKIIATYPNLIEQTRRTAEMLAEPVQALNKRAAARRVTVEGVTFDNYKDAMKAAVDAVELQQADNENARYAITVNGQRLTNKAGIDDAIGAGFGDASPFEADIQGEAFTQRTAAGRALSALLSPKAMTKTGSGTAGAMLGMELKYQFSESKFVNYGVDVDVWLESDGKTIASDFINDHNPSIQYTTAQMRDLLGRLAEYVESKSRPSRANAMQTELEAARSSIPKLEERVREPFQKAQELKDKRLRLNEVVGILTAPTKTEQTTQATSTPSATGNQGAFDPTMGTSARAVLNH